MNARPRLFYIDTEDPDRSLDDPGLGALAAQGWTIGSATPVVTKGRGGQDVVRLMFVLWPPTIAARAATVASGLSVVAAVLWIIAGAIWIWGAM